MGFPSNPQNHLVLHARAWDACCALEGASQKACTPDLWSGRILNLLVSAQFGLGKPLDPFLQQANL